MPYSSDNYIYHDLHSLVLITGNLSLLITFIQFPLLSTPYKSSLFSMTLLIQQAKLFSGIQETVDSWYTTWWVSISIHFKTITAVSLVLIIQRYYIIIDSRLYTSSRDSFFVVSGSLCLLISFTHFSPLPTLLPSDSDLSVLCIYDSALVLLCLFICPQKSEVIQYFPFSVWLISLIVTPSMSIHVVTNGKI